MHKVKNILLIGLILRVIAAACGVGWFAMDDYTHVIEPAGRWLSDPNLPFHSWYRSELFPRVFSWLLGVGHAIFGGDPGYGLKAAYLALGLWSLPAIPAAYQLARPRLGGNAALTAALLVAAHPLLPHVSTLALLTVVAIPPLLWGLVFIDRARTGPGGARFTNALLGTALVGIACLFRFQVGVIFPALAIVLFVPTESQAMQPRPRRAQLRALAGFLAGGLLAALGQGLIDMASGRVFLETLAQYVRFNTQHSSTFGTSSWYNYILLFVGLTIPPLTIWFAKPLWRALRKHLTVALVLLAFVVAHTLIPHKEERFMFTVLPVFFVVLGAALVETRTWVRRVFWAVNIAVLLVVTISDANRNLTTPLLEIARTRQPMRVATLMRPEVAPSYYAGPRAELRDYATIEEAAGWRPDFILFRDHPGDEILEALGCTARAYDGDFVDRALLFLNERPNRRRRATVLATCE